MQLIQAINDVEKYELASVHSHVADVGLKVKVLEQVHAGDPEGALVSTNPVLFLPLNKAHEKHFPSKRMKFEGHWHEGNPAFSVYINVSEQ